MAKGINIAKWMAENRDYLGWPDEIALSLQSRGGRK
jgi:hypothetical protein